MPRWLTILEIEIAFAAPDGDDAQATCSSGACGSGGGAASNERHVQELEGGYRVFVTPADAGHPDRLTASLARSIGGLVLLEAGEEGAQRAETLQAAELVAAACGFGVLLANGAAVWAKSCGGLRMSQRTILSVEEIGVALALFVAVHGLRASVACAHLGATQREAFERAQAWTESNPFVVETLREAPSLLEADAFRLEPLRSMLGRWLHQRRLKKEMQLPAVAQPAVRSEEQRRRLEEARALVDEVMGDR